MKCDACHQSAEIVSITHEIGVHWCDKLNAWLYTNGKVWTTNPQLKGVLRGASQT